MLCGCHSGIECHMLTISPLAKGHQLKQKEKVKCINVRVVDFDFRPWRCFVEFFTVYRFEVYVKYILAYTGVLLYIYKYMRTALYALCVSIYKYMRTALYALCVSCVLLSPDSGIRNESRSIFIIDPSFTWFFCFDCSAVVLVWLADDGWQWLPVGFGLCCVSFFLRGACCGL